MGNAHRLINNLYCVFEEKDGHAVAKIFRDKDLKERMFFEKNLGPEFDDAFKKGDVSKMKDIVEKKVFSYR